MENKLNDTRQKQSEFGDQLIECVPNFSEGNDESVINLIVESISSVSGVKVLHVDSGRSANRTVVTFAGNPSSVCEAAFLAVKCASRLIDMSKHHGKHPRFGAIDVLPLIPIRNISMDETVKYAKNLGLRIGNELGIPGYYYEYAATNERRRNLASCRAGEYEALASKIIRPEWKPDFGPATFTKQVRRSGAIALGARDLLLAYNVNLNTKSSRTANCIAFDVRESGWIKREGDPLTGNIIRDKNGKVLRTNGLLKGVKGIGWYLEDFDIAQASYNITNTKEASIHQVFERTCERAEFWGVKVTGSELIGMIPLKQILDAGIYFLKKNNLSTAISEKEIINFAIKSMGLDELSPFEPKRKIIEYQLED